MTFLHSLIEKNYKLWNKLLEKTKDVNSMTNMQSIRQHSLHRPNTKFTNIKELNRERKTTEDERNQPQGVLSVDRHKVPATA